MLSITAIIIIAPRPNLNQFPSTLVKIKILSINASKKVPTRAPKADPIPPNKEAPPTTAAEIACNSKPIPRLVMAVLILKD